MDRRVGSALTAPGVTKGTTGTVGGKRHQAFPNCVIDVLEQITKFCGQQYCGKWRTGSVMRNNELQHLIDNDLFCISADRRVSRLNSMQQLRLLQILCDYFNEKESVARGHQYLFFETVFCGREGESLLHEARISLLIKLCSLAIQYPCYLLLNHVSQWLHKIGSAKSYAQQFISYLTDHFVMMPSEWNLHSYLIPLADEAPEFVSYFIAYSVSKEALKKELITVLTSWLTGRRSSRIIVFIKETPAVAKQFASSTFAHLVFYDCIMGGSPQNSMHGITTILYADWDSSVPLNFLSALEMLNEDETVFDEKILRFHIHLARKSKVLSSKEFFEFCSRPNLNANIRSILDMIKTQNF